MTRNQSASIRWWEQRIGRITEIKFGEVHNRVFSINKLTAKSKRVNVIALIMSIVEPEKLYNVPPLEWGKANEGNAEESFMKHEGHKHKFPKVINCGIYIHKPHPYMGATPGNIFTFACCENACVESIFHSRTNGHYWEQADLLCCLDRDGYPIH